MFLEAKQRDVMGLWCWESTASNLPAIISQILTSVPPEVKNNKNNLTLEKEKCMKFK